MSQTLNIAGRLRDSASRYPHQRAIVVPLVKRERAGRRQYREMTFEQLDRETDRLARGFVEMGIPRGARIVLMVRPGIEFIALVFALFKCGSVVVLIDPGMGGTNIFRCLELVEPDGFVAIPMVHAIRLARRNRFPAAKFNVTVGRRWFWGGPTYQSLLGESWTPSPMAETKADEPAAIIFTSGSTGPPKGVLYEHGMFDAQVDLIRDFYRIEPGETDLPGFPLFALFNLAMGVTTVVPDMNPSRPARVEPRNIIEAINDQHVTQAFGSPALWNRVGRFCENSGITFPTIRRALSAGAPVPIHVVERMQKTLTAPGAALHTPYGATESLPVASISSREVLDFAAEKTRQGAGTCVGRRFPGISVKIIEMSSSPIATLNDARELPVGEIGEIIVKGPSVTREYFRRPDATANAKILDEEGFWHRMGDVGYLDSEDRLWFCGRKAHVVETAGGRMFTEPCEGILNEHPRVYRTALVGVGPRPDQEPVVVVEPEGGSYPRSRSQRERFEKELIDLASGNALTSPIKRFLFRRALPVDTRHNVKIDREQLSLWAERQLRR
ncbi:MAG: fatty acid CoA ligase family protein [Planctomycetaceae bacterium]